MKFRRVGRKLPVTEIVVVAIVLALVAAVVFFAKSRSGSDDPNSPPDPNGASVVQKAKKADEQHLTLFVDGWTQQILRDAHPKYVANTSGGAAGAGQALTFTPIEDDDLGAIATNEPDILTRVAARMMTVDPKLTCTRDGCTTAAGKMPLAWFRNPGDIPGFGASYAAYGITSSLYKADLYVPKDATVFSVSADGYDQIEFAVSKGKPAVQPGASAAASTTPATPTPTATASGMPSEIGPDDAINTGGEQFVPDPLNGYGRGWFLLSAGLGRFFAPDPAWLGKTGTGPTMDQYVLGELSTDRPTAAALAKLTAVPPFAQGLAVPAPQAKGLTASQLTVFTSPTVGCGVGVTCVPGKVDVTYSDVQPAQTADVCLTDKARVGEVGTVVFHTRRWTLTYPQPTHQYGVWDGKSPSQFSGARAGADGLYSGQPPLVNGKQTLRVTEAVIATGADGNVFHVLGSVAQQGKDKPADFTQTVSRDQISQFEGGMFTTC